MLSFGLVFVVAGLAFKLGVVPFHMWVPDVYHGAPTPVTLMIGGAPEFAAFAITIRLLVEGMSGLAPEWQQMLVVLSVASLVLGNLVAIAQSNLKRMLAYSTIGQMGFMLLGLTPTVIGANTLSAANAYSSSMFYIVTYVLTTLGTFGLIMLLSRQGFESEEISDLAGLGQRAPWMAGVMTLLMFSLAGVPPLVGFYAKLSILQALVDHRRGVLHRAGGVCGADVAGGRVLLPAHRQGDVLRSACRRHAGDPKRHRGERLAGRQRRRGAGAGAAARRPDGDVPRRDPEGAHQLSATAADAHAGRDGARSASCTGAPARALRRAVSRCSRACCSTCGATSSRCPTVLVPRANTSCIPGPWWWCRCSTTAAWCWSVSTAIRSVGVMLEFPAGKIDAGEPALQCAQRELAEETGYRARQWAVAGVLHNAMAYSHRGDPHRVRARAHARVSARSTTVN